MTKNALNDFQQQLCQHLLSPQLEQSSELLLAQFKSQFSPVNGENKGKNKGKRKFIVITLFIH